MKTNESSVVSHIILSEQSDSITFVAGTFFFFFLLENDISWKPYVKKCYHISECRKFC